MIKGKNTKLRFNGTTYDADVPFEGLSEEEEALLVKQGIAEYVDEPLVEATSGDEEKVNKEDKEPEDEKLNEAFDDQNEISLDSLKLDTNDYVADVQVPVSSKCGKSKPNGK